MKLAVTIFAALVVAGCADEREMAFAACETERLKLPRETLLRVTDRWLFMNSCMSSKGYTVKLKTSVCENLDFDGPPSCHKKPGLVESIKALTRTQ
jgi:hypothetical protein